jgi:hypothetical protein
MIPRMCFLFAVSLTLPAQPKPPFTAAQAEHGKEIAAKSVEIRAQIKNMRDSAEPMKIMGNLYFVGVANGEVYLLTSPQGHIMFGAAFPETTGQMEKNIQTMGFKVSDIKVILLNHNHGDQSGAAAYFKEKSGAQVMAGFAEIPLLEHGGVLPSPAPAGGPGGYPPVKVDRALFDGDVIKVGPLTVTAYLAPGHSPSPTSFLYTVRESGKDYRVFEFCCWEYPDDLNRNVYINEASVRHNLELFRKVLPVDIDRMAKLRSDHLLFVNRDIFRDWSAWREVEFEEKLAKLKASGVNLVYTH